MLIGDDVEITCFFCCFFVVVFFREFHEKLTVMALCSFRHFYLFSKVSQKVFKPEP